MVHAWLDGPRAACARSGCARSLPWSWAGAVYRPAWDASRCRPARRSASTDPTALPDIGGGPFAALFGCHHIGETKSFCFRVFRYDVKRILQHGRVVLADRANIGTTPATCDDA